MKNILVIGSSGQIGSELTRELRKRYGNEHVVAGYIKGAEPSKELQETGPMAEADVTNGEMIAEIVRKYNIDAIITSPPSFQWWLRTSPSWLGRLVSMVFGTSSRWPRTTSVRCLRRVASVLSAPTRRRLTPRRTRYSVRRPSMV